MTKVSATRPCRDVGLKNPLLLLNSLKMAPWCLNMQEFTSKTMFYDPFYCILIIAFCKFKYRIFRHVRDCSTDWRTGTNSWTLRYQYEVCLMTSIKVKVKVSRNRPEQAQGVPDRLRPRIFLTFGTTRVVGRQPYTPAAFIPGEIPGTHFQRLSRPQGTWFCRKEPRKKSQVTPRGIYPRIVRLLAQRLNHYATLCPLTSIILY
jgi:hypothetical protein